MDGKFCAAASVQLANIISADFQHELSMPGEAVFFNYVHAKQVKLKLFDDQRQRTRTDAKKASFLETAHTTETILQILVSKHGRTIWFCGYHNLDERGQYSR